MRQKIIVLITVFCFAVVLFPTAVTQVSDAVSRYKEQWKAIKAGCEAERQRLGLKKLPNYPTLEVSYQPVQAVPGATVNMAAKGNFEAGTKVLVASDEVEVLKQSITKNEYSATVRLSPEVGPGLIRVYAYRPITCGQNLIGRIGVGGRYDWTLTASNGWLLKFKTLEGSFGAGQEKQQLEFYRSGEAKPFQVLDGSGDSSKQPYSGWLSFNGGDIDATREEIRGVEEQLRDPELDAGTRADLQTQLQELQKRLETELVYGKLEADCNQFTLHKQPTADYRMDVTCSPPVGNISATGKAKFTGS